MHTSYEYFTIPVRTPLTSNDNVSRYTDIRVQLLRLLPSAVKSELVISDTAKKKRWNIKRRQYGVSGVTLNLHIGGVIDQGIGNTY